MGGLVIELGLLRGPCPSPSPPQACPTPGPEAGGSEFRPWFQPTLLYQRRPLGQEPILLSLDTAPLEVEVMTELSTRRGPALRWQMPTTQDGARGVVSAQGAHAPLLPSSTGISFIYLLSSLQPGTQ